MPTGYTYKLAEGEQSPREFMLEAARAFGAYYSLRDAGPGLPPRLLPPPQDPTAELEGLEEELQALRERSPGEWREAHQEEVAALEERNRQEEARAASLRARFEKMLEVVEAWEPPTGDHSDYKDFLLQQLRDTLAWEGTAFTTPPPAWEGYREKKLAAAQEALAWRKKSYQQALSNHKREQAWVDALWDSLPPAGEDLNKTNKLQEGQD